MTLRNLSLSFGSYDNSHNWNEVPNSKLLDDLQQEIHEEIERIRKTGCPRSKIADLALLMDIMLEKDFDRIDRILIYRIAKEKEKTDLGLIYWMDDILRLVRHTGVDITELHSWLTEMACRKWETSTAFPTPTKELSNPADTVGNGSKKIIVDQHRPIAYDDNSGEFIRVDTESLRSIQAQLNDFIDYVCSAEETGNLVVDMCDLLEHLLDTNFFCSGFISDMLRSCGRNSANSYGGRLLNLRDIARGFENKSFTPDELDQAIDALCNRNFSKFAIVRRDNLPAPKPESPRD